MSAKGKVINDEMEKRRVSLCFKCGAVFTSPAGVCPECGSGIRTRWITQSRSWLNCVRWGLFTEPRTKQ